MCNHNVLGWGIPPVDCDNDTCAQTPNSAHEQGLPDARPPAKGRQALADRKPHECSIHPKVENEALWVAKAAEELEHISMDGTIRLLRRVRCQVDYLASLDITEQAPTQTASRREGF